jgi:hypothetical protein
MTDKPVTTLKREIEWLRRAIEEAEKPGAIVFCDLEGMKKSLKELEAGNVEAQ